MTNVQYTLDTTLGRREGLRTGLDAEKRDVPVAVRNIHSRPNFSVVRPIA
jgi:hypothetical protein